MKIAYLGNYNPEYARHKILKKGLSRNGIEIIDCHFKAKGWRKLISIWKQKKKFRQADIVYAAYSDSRYIWFLRLVTRKPIFWDAYYSIYDNWIFDRKYAKPKSLKARYYWFLDWICSVSANVVILDTDTNCQYFIDTFHINPKKFLRVLIGADDDIFKPRPQQKTMNKFLVEFHGNYIPVQGVEYIIRAAKLLENEEVYFKMIGSGQTRAQAEDLAQELGLENLEFIPPVPMAEVPSYIAEADVCLGLLGSVPRTNRSIPNKVYEASAMKRVSINADTPAIRELYIHDKNIVLCRAGDPEDLAKKIMYIKNNPGKKERIGQEAYRVYIENVTPQKLILPLIDRARVFMAK